MSAGVVLARPARSRADAPRADGPRAEPGLSPAPVLRPLEGAGNDPAWAVDPYPGAARLHAFADRGHAFGAGDPGGAERAFFTGRLGSTLRRDLTRVGPGEIVALGHRAEPYPQTEKRHVRTRSVLRALLETEGHTLRLTTRSDLVIRDLELLREVARHHVLRVDMEIPTPDRRLASALDPAAPRPDLRLKAISELAAEGVPAGLVLAPILPGIGDDPGALDALAAAAVAAGAVELRAVAACLAPSDLARRFPCLEREFPDLFDRHRRRYARSALVPDDVREGLDDLVGGMRRRHGLAGGWTTRCEATPVLRGPQLDLF